MSGSPEPGASAPASVASRATPIASMAVAGVALVLYAVGSIRTGGLEPGSRLGLAFGIAAAAALLAVMLYSVRRGLPAVRSLGRTRQYLQIHVWVGLLFLLLFLLHTGFRVPGGVLNFTLWAVSLWVVATGAVGLFLQRGVPRILDPTATFEVHLRRIPELVGELRGRAEETASRAGPRVQAFYEQRWAPEMEAPRMVATELFRNPGAQGRAAGEIEILKRTLPEESVATLEELEGLHAAKREMDVHFTLQRVLRGWLVLHLPVAIVLLGLVALHVFFVLYF
jgi:hypothetical protein